jgi:hypothetical protein
MAQAYAVLARIVVRRLRWLGLVISGHATTAWRAGHCE